MKNICLWCIAIILLFSMELQAATVIWSGASGADTNWSNGNNWGGSVAPGGGDDVKLFDAGTNLTVGLPNSLVNVAFAGYIGSLQFGQSNGVHTVQIEAAQTLNITNAGGLFVGTSGDVGAARVLTNSIKGAGAALNLSNTNANLVLNQGQNSANGSRAVLDLSGLDTFTANINAIGIGSTHFQNAVAQRNSGILFLARTNNIRLNLANTLANYSTLGTPTSAIEMAHAGAGNNATALCVLYLGQTNAIYVDSMTFGRSKASVASAAIMMFNPAFASPSAYFRGMNGAASRVTWWAIGDMADSASSAQQSVGTNDFSLGTVDALVETMSLGRDCSPQHTASGFNIGVLTFTAGTIDVNNLIAGNQAIGPNTSFAGNLGIVNVNGSAARLVVNNTLELAHTAVTYTPGVGGTNAAKTQGILNIRNGGTVFANRITVGASSTNNNTIALTNGTLVLSNSVGTPAKGVMTFAITNSTLRLNITGITNIFCTNLVSSGVSNLISPDSVAVFSSYPKQIVLIKYISQLGLGVTNFALTNVPASAPGAYLSNNLANSSLDLVLPFDPRPVITAQPTSYSGNPGDNVIFNVTVSGNSATPLSYQWYLGATPVANGPTGNGSTNSGSTTASLNITNAQPGDNGSYTVVIANAYGSATSAPPAVLTISAGNVAPSLTGPNNTTVIQGNNATFSATVAGNPVPALQWRRNGVDISGQTSASYTITSAQYPADDGAVFSLIATNIAGSVTNSAALTVIVPPTISVQPASLVVTNTQAASFSVTAGGVPAPAYQWYFNNNPISNETNSTYNLASAASANIGPYKVVVYNTAGSVTSSNATLTVNSLMSVTATSPSNGQAGVCYDTPLYATFSSAPTLRSGSGVGAIKIFNITNSTTPVDTLDLSQGASQLRGIGGDNFKSYPVLISGSTAAIYPHSGVLKSNATYYVTIDNGVFADSTGAYFAGITATNVWQFATKVGGPANPAKLVVAADGSGDFATVQGAVDSVTLNSITPTLLNIRNGTYKEIVNIKSRNNLDLRGQSRSSVVIGYPDNDALNPGAPLRACFVLNANDCTLENLTLTNTTPKGGSQAEAIDVEGTRTVLYNMELDSYQDTFLVHSAGKLVYFQDCLVQGDTDFNWGLGTVYYTNCEIRALSSGAHVTQPRSPFGSNGFAFVNCRITKGFASGTFDLGRTISTPLISPSEVLFAHCLMDDAVTGYSSDAGTNMSDYACSNLTATVAKSLTFSTHLTSSDPFVIAAQSAVTWLYGWQPQVSPNILTNPVSATVGAGQAVSFVVSATGIPDPGYQWQHAGTNLTGATGATLNIGSAHRSDGGSYAVVVSNGSGTVTSSVATLTYTNTAPVAGAGFSLGALIGIPSTIPIIGGKYPPSDVDNDALSITSVAGATNGTASTDGTSVTYTATNGTADTFTYTVSDGFGGTSSATVTVTINADVQSYNQLSLVTLGGGTNVVTFLGIPGYNYALDLATNLLSPINWMPQTTNPAAVNGFLIFTNVSTEPQSYYRTRYAP